MERPAKKRVLRSNADRKNDQIKGKITKTSCYSHPPPSNSTLDATFKSEPAEKPVWQLLNEIVPDDKNLTIKLEYDPDTPVTPDCLNLLQIQTRGGKEATGQGGRGSGRGGGRGGGSGGRGGDVGESEGARGRGRGRGRGVEIEGGGVTPRPVHRGRVRVRGGRGAHIERSPMYVGDIFSAADSTSMAVGIPQETPLHEKRPRRRWNPNQIASPVSESLETVGEERLDLPQTSRSAIYENLVPSPAEFMEVGESINTSIPIEPRAQPSSTSVNRKRKLVYNVLDPELENLVNYGSDVDSDSEDEECGPYGFMQCPRSERILMDLLDESVTSPVSTSPPTLLPTGEQALCTETEETFYPHRLTDFIWNPLPQLPIPPQQRRETFTASVGPVTSFISPYESFVAIWDRSVMEHIAAETNRYANQTLEVALSQGDLGGYSRILQFKETDADELYVFFALLLGTGIVVKAKMTEYWSINDDIFDTPNFSRYMTYTRFIGIAQMLHFFDNDLDISQLSKSEAKIAKIAPIVQHLNEKFQTLYQLGQSIALDESLTQWKGRLSINQFIKNKVAAKGVKTYEVCDSRSGYLWRLKMHAGRNEEDEKEFEYITSLVLELLTGLENKGHTVFMDNFYNSPLLARLLKSRGFDVVGTLRLNRQHVPTDLKSLTKNSVPVGSVHGSTSGDVDVLVWKDKNLVSLISTYHGAASASRDGKAKPTLIHDYNVRMGGVDKKDQMLSAYPIERKRTAVWYKKVFRRLLNVSVLNSYIMHKESPAPEHPHPHIVTHRDYRKTLIIQILEKHGQERSVVLKPTQSGLKVKFSKEMISHFPREYPFEGKQRKRRSCGVCHKRTHTNCTGCNIALCLDPCFIKYHS